MPNRNLDALLGPDQDEIILSLAPRVEELVSAYRTVARAPNQRNADRLIAELSWVSTRVQRLRNAITQE